MRSADQAISTTSLASWTPESVDAQWQETVEQGGVLYCPQLAFTLSDAELRYLDPKFSDARRKSIYIRGDRPGLFGTEAEGADRDALLALIERFRDASTGLIARIFPGYVGKMKAAGTSFRPRPTGEGTALSWRKDDTRLHVDAFPSNPTHGMRILRVFTNIGHAPRVWRVGEPFEAMAQHFLQRIRPPLPGSAALLRALRITKRKRSAYDHYMLHLHDDAKADLAYQKACDQVTFGFAPGSSWICYSDQVMHAVMGGQFMMEQTIHVPLDALAYPEYSPLGVLERLTGVRLVARGANA